MADPHTIATFAFAQMRRSPSFAREFSWVRNTVVCVDSDLADDVLNGQLLHYFGDEGGTVACYYPADKKFLFAHVGARVSAKPGEPPPEPTPGVRQMKDSVESPMKIGDVLNAMYSRAKGDNSNLMEWDGTSVRDPHMPNVQPLIAEASTAEIEKTLSLA